MIIFIPIKHISQRVPNKNFRIFNNEPLYKNTLLKFTQDEVWVDTDSDVIIDQIRKDERLNNINLIKRKKTLLGHKTSVCDLIIDFIKERQIAEPIVQIHVTSPFLKRETIIKAYKNINNYDSIVSCNLHQSRFWRKESYGYTPVNHNPIKLEQTQDLPTYYEENSAFYIFEPNVILASGNRIGANPFFFPISRPENLDIDVEQDWNECLKEIK